MEYKTYFGRRAMEIIEQIACGIADVFCGNLEPGRGYDLIEKEFLQRRQGPVVLRSESMDFLEQVTKLHETYGPKTRIVSVS